MVRMSTNVQCIFPSIATFLSNGLMLFASTNIIAELKLTQKRSLRRESYYCFEVDRTGWASI